MCHVLQAAKESYLLTRTQTRKQTYFGITFDVVYYEPKCSFALLFITPGIFRLLPKTLLLPPSCIMTDCEELCAPICRARPYCLTLSCTPLEAFQTSLLSCQVTNSLFHLFLPIFFPFLCKQVVWLCLRISGALWNSNHFLYYPLCFLCVKIDATLLQNSFVIIGIIVNAISADLHVDEDEQEASVQRDSSHVDWRHSYGNIYWSSASNWLEIWCG